MNDQFMGYLNLFREFKLKISKNKICWWILS